MSPVAGIQPHVPEVNLNQPEQVQNAQHEPAPAALHNARPAHPHRARAARVFSAMFTVGITEIVRAVKAHHASPAYLQKIENTHVARAVAQILSKGADNPCLDRHPEVKAKIEAQMHALEACTISDNLKTAWKKDWQQELRAAFTDKNKPENLTNAKIVERSGRKFASPARANEAAEHIKGAVETLSEALHAGKTVPEVLHAGQEAFKSYGAFVMGALDGQDFGADDRAAMWTKTFQALADKVPALAEALRTYPDKEALLTQANTDADTARNAKPGNRFFDPNTPGNEKMAIITEMQANSDLKCGLNNMLHFLDV